jgi:hypothetical protein
MVEHRRRVGAYVVCPSCCAQGPVGGTAEIARDHWNNREFGFPYDVLAALSMGEIALSEARKAVSSARDSDAPNSNGPSPEGFVR